MEDRLRIVFAGGGTGGHLFPALNLARAMEERWPVRFKFFGTQRGIEQTKVPEAGYELVCIPVAGFHRRVSLDNIRFPFRLWKSLKQSKRELRAFGPHLVIGTGGYVMGPVLKSAVKLGYPIMMQEQNSYPGMTTRLLARDADLVFVAYEEAVSFLNCRKVVVTGNPIRYREMEEERSVLLERLGLRADRKVILVFGGSQGSVNINLAMKEILLDPGVPEGFQVLWQCGIRSCGECRSFVHRNNLQQVMVTAFIDPMYEAYHIAEFAVCRSGAMTLSELMAYGIPALLIPLPGAAADHQYKNAQAVAGKGGAVVIRDDEFLVSSLKKEWVAFTDGSKNLEVMRKSMKRMHRKDTIPMILDHIDRFLTERKIWPSGRH